MQPFPWVRFTVLTTGLLGVGYVMMRATVPTEEETYQAMAPDLRKRVDARRAARLAREAEMEKQVEAQTRSEQSAPEESKPIWADSRK